MYNQGMYGNQMYSNQAYGQQYNPYQQYFQQQQIQQQPQQQVQRIASPYCRMINSVEEIRADEIPMDGSVGIFVKNNMNELYAKSWNSITGGIDTIRYIPAIDEVKDDKKEVAQLDLNKEFESFKNEMFERFDKLEKSLGKQNVNNRKNVKEGE